MRFRLRTLLIVLALGPALIAGAWSIWRNEVAYQEGQRRRAAIIQFMHWGKPLPTELKAEVEQLGPEEAFRRYPPKHVP